LALIPSSLLLEPKSDRCMAGTRDRVIRHADTVKTGAYPII